MNLNELPLYTKVKISCLYYRGEYVEYDAVLVEHLANGRVRMYRSGMELGGHNNHIIPTFFPNGERVGVRGGRVERVVEIYGADE